MGTFFTALLAALLWAFAVMLPVGAFSLLLHYLLSLPMQRRDRARFFLDLLETAIERGQPVEQPIIADDGVVEVHSDQHPALTLRPSR